MNEGDRGEGPRGQWGRRACDLLVVGGGVMGLWAALKAGRAGLSVTLLDAGRLGEGASYGHLGALMAHTPDKWNAKKQFQFDALVSLEDELREVEALTGLSAGYRRTGRLIPLPKPHLREIALRHQDDAVTNWQAGGRQFEWRVTDEPPAAGWPDASEIEGGYVLDTFAARAAPRAFTSVLAAALGTMPNVAVVEREAVRDLDAQAGLAVTESGKRTSFGHCIVAAGYKSFAMLEALVPRLEKPLGMPVKGQSALLAADIDPELPLIFLNGLYVIPHDRGGVAIGSTSENSFEDASATDDQLETLIERARALVPALRDASVVERWAGLRPKAIARDPMVGPVPGAERIIALTGGFKISFGVAHRLADFALGGILGQVPEGLPESFRFANHLL